MTNPDSDQPFTEEEALALRRAADELVESQARIVWLGTEAIRLRDAAWKLIEKSDAILQPIRKAEWKRADRRENVRLLLFVVPISATAVWVGSLSLKWMSIRLGRPELLIFSIGMAACSCLLPCILQYLTGRLKTKKATHP